MALCISISSSLVYSQSIINNTFKTITKGDFTYAGAFRIPNTKLGDSLANYSSGVIALGKNNQSLYMVGHQKNNAVAEFILPKPSFEKDVDDLPIASVMQNFSSLIKNKKITGTQIRNSQNLNRINGMLYEKGKLFVNMLEYYDADGQNTHTTLVAENAHNLAESSIKGFYAIEGGTKIAGWYSKIPQEWQTVFDSEYIVGSAANYPINSRQSIGPSAALIDLDAFNEYKGGSVPSKTLLGFSLKNRLNKDLFNKSLKNDLWTHKSQAWYGFIVPNTNTYVTIGWSGGHHSGIGYKHKGRKGKKCPGYCAVDEQDYYNYMWLWDVRDMLKVYKGEAKPYELRPYEWGEFKVPFEHGEDNDKAQFNQIGGATFDSVNSILYVSLRGVDRLRNFAHSPIIVSFKLSK